MKHFKTVKEYSVLEINDILDSLRVKYDIVRLVDVEECRILDVKTDGSIHYGKECFQIWNRKNRCDNCSSYRACKTYDCMDKTEPLGNDREAIHSVPVSLKMPSGECQMAVIECVKYAGPAEDISHREQAEYLATRDVLTRLYTREKLLRQIRQRLLEKEDEQYLLLMINIRNITMINKIFGIEGGNRLLVGFADILRACLGKEEVYGRYRNDRFIILMKKENFSEEEITARLLEGEKLVDSPIFKVQFKAGVYEIPHRNMSVAAMVERAELAVNSIRDSHDSQIAYFLPDMFKRKLKDQQIVSDFEKAVQNGEFQIYLQPQIRDNTIAGAEALVRWIRSDGRMLLPMEFLDVLRMSELLTHLDLYIWEQAVCLLAKWKKTDMADLHVSINVDPGDFYYVDVARALADLCVKYDVDPALLRVEITETALVNDMEGERSLVDKLHKEGFLVEIDDFGKGSSSLSLLKDISADVLKIDMGFLRNSINSDRSRIILEAVVEMAQNLDMDVISEGVETREQIDGLLKLGCRSFQGYFYSRPLPVEDFVNLYMAAC